MTDSDHLSETLAGSRAAALQVLDDLLGERGADALAALRELPREQLEAAAWVLGECTAGFCAATGGRDERLRKGIVDEAAGKAATVLTDPRG